MIHAFKDCLFSYDFRTFFPHFLIELIDSVVSPTSLWINMDPCIVLAEKELF